ncbi:MAG: inhibitor of KinA [Sediminicola sp.]|jgi:inhibitor of KinA|tara:strand:+ start:2770 stop:3498 length:729 start_codon:yes stop_codon:yes gene_type:complete
MNFQPTYQHFGENGVLINWPSKIDPQINDEVLRLDILITKTFGDRIIELVPSYQSLAVYLKEVESVSNFIELLKELPISEDRRYEKVSRLITIPVCYDPKYGLDIEELALANKITTKKVIQLHTKEIYKVYFLGFLPGFPYLGGLNESLYTPRKNKPRKHITEGSVAIGGEQTGIYTIDSPGGWNVIGRSPLAFFSCESSLRCLLKPGDFVRFSSIDETEFKKIEAEVANDTFQVGKEVYHD